MHFKLLVALVDDSRTDAVMDAARDSGATGATVIAHARGEGLRKPKTFFGLTLETQRDIVMFLVEEHLSRTILERVAEVAHFDEEEGSGIAFQLDVEDAVGVMDQVRTLSEFVERKL